MILFTSGSEGAPKGVVLSHRNILANVAQVAARIDFGRRDKVFNALPVFHSFGLTGGLVLPLVSGVPIYLYPSPLHYRIIPELVYDQRHHPVRHRHLPHRLRPLRPSLRFPLAALHHRRRRGGEGTTRRLYAEKFGVRILEGYGVTETAPVLALNTPMFNRSARSAGSAGHRRSGSRPSPGIDDGGRLHVRGPNVMLGYLRAEKPGVLEPPPDGWHDTGDIVAIDAEGFVTIKGRAKRFAKIGGEMVSLAAVEALAARVLARRQGRGDRAARPAQGRADHAAARSGQGRRAATSCASPRRRARPN